MRRPLTLLTVVVLTATAACGSGPDRTPAPDDTPTPSAAASPSTGAPPPAASAPAGGPSSPPAGGPSSPPAAPSRTPATSLPPPGSGELPGELPHGGRKLTGVVERSGDCVALRVGQRLWGLSGTRAGTLSAGERVTVAGQMTAADAGCATPGVTQTLVVRRVTPA